MNMIPLKEDLYTEFKSTFNISVVESLVAFANTSGGAVYVGVNDSGRVKGVTLAQESVQQWINEVKSKTEPSLVPHAEIITYDDKEIVILSTHDQPIKPISVQGRCYKRVGSSNHLLNVSEISDLYMQTMQNSWDSYFYKNADIDDLELEKIKQFVSKVNAVKRFFLPVNPIDALTKLNMIKNNKPTNASMILFSKENLRNNVHIGRFKTPSLIIADKMISTQRKEIPEYPLDGLRELMVNSLVHRDYQSPTDIQIRIYDKSISFFNPSGLFGNITEEALHTDTYHASTRNKQIAEAFYLTNDIEKYGSGFSRIRKAIAEYPTMKFSFQNLGHGFLTSFSYDVQKISLTNENVVENVVEKETLLLPLIQGNKKISAQEIAIKLNLTSRTIQRYLKVLQNKGLIVRIGSSKGGYWKIN